MVADQCTSSRRRPRLFVRRAELSDWMPAGAGSAVPHDVSPRLMVGKPARLVIGVCAYGLKVDDSNGALVSATRTGQYGGTVGDGDWLECRGRP